HARHVPVGDQEVEAAGLQHGQGGLAVVRFRHVGVTQVVQQILDDPTHGRKIIDDQELHIFTHSFDLPRAPLDPQTCSSTLPSRQSASRAFSLTSACPCSWQTRDSVTFNTAPISLRLSPSL